VALTLRPIESGSISLTYHRRRLRVSRSPLKALEPICSGWVVAAMLISQRSTAAREVLVVDDDVGTREALSDLLHDRGYLVISAADGREARNYLRNSPPPGIIILDLMMPVMDGWEFLEHQARDPALFDIPVIVVTATPPQHSLRAIAIQVQSGSSLWLRCWSDSCQPRLPSEGQVSEPRTLRARRPTDP
jgi:CheY-like chemotaxis protein